MTTPVSVQSSIAKMNPSFLKFYLIFLWGLDFIAIRTPSFHIKKLEIHWIPVVRSTIRLLFLLTLLVDDLTKLVNAPDYSVELEAIMTSTVFVDISAAAAVQLASTLKTKDTYTLFKFTLTKRPRSDNYIQPTVIASGAVAIFCVADTIWFYFFNNERPKIELLDGTLLSTDLPVVSAIYFMMLVAVSMTTPFALSYLVIFGLEFTQHYDSICDGLLRLSHATDRPHGEHQASIQLQITSLKQALKIGKHCQRKYLKTARIYSFFVLFQCCLMVLHYLAYNIADFKTDPFSLGSSRYAVMSTVLMYLLTRTGNAAETRGLRGKFTLLNARESCGISRNKKIARVVRWAGSWNCRMSALGCLDVNYGVIIKAFTFVSTYFICYLQMQLTAKN